MKKKMFGWFLILGAGCGCRVFHDPQWLCTLFVVLTFMWSGGLISSLLPIQVAVCPCPTALMNGKNICSTVMMPCSALDLFKFLRTKVAVIVYRVVWDSGSLSSFYFFLCYVHIAKVHFPFQLQSAANITGGKHPTVEVSSVDRCYSQADKQDWR